MDPQFQSWLQQARTSGMTDEQIRQQLLSTGWTDVQIKAVFAGTPIPEKLETKNGIAGVGTLYAAAFKNYGSRFVNYLVYGVIASIVEAAIIVGGGILVAQVINLGSNPFISRYSSNNTSFILPFVAIILIALIFLAATVVVYTWLWAANAITISTTNPLQNIFRIAGDAFRRIGQIWWANFIVGFILSGFGFIAYIGAALVGISIAVISSSFLIALIAVLIYFALLAWIGTYLMFTGYVVITEQKRGMHAVLMSHALVQGNWWRIFGRLVAYFAPAGVLILLLTWLAGSFGDIGWIASLIVSVISGVVLTPIGVTYMYGVYNTLRVEKIGVQESGKKTAVALLIAGGLGWLIVIAFLVFAFFSSAPTAIY